MADPLSIGKGLRVGAAVAGSVSSIVASSAQARASAQAAVDNEAAVRRNADRQSIEAATDAQHAETDRRLLGNREQARARVNASSRGASRSTRLAMIRQLGAAEGTDLSRIKQTLEARQAAISSQVNAAEIRRDSQIREARMMKTYGALEGVLGGIGAGMQIYSDLADNAQALKIMDQRIAGTK